jgi:hypothetical protein
MHQYKENPYNPFPSEMQGPYCEIAKDDYIQFVSIYYIKYDNEEVLQLKARGAFEGSRIEDTVYFIYRLEIYKGSKDIIKIKDDWEFNKNIFDYEVYGFTMFNSLIDFCSQRWGITVKDFIPLHKTHFPQ